MSISARTQHPHCWPVATERQLNAPLNLPPTTLAWKTPARALAGAVGLARRQRLPPPPVTCRVKPTTESRARSKRP